MKQYMPKEEKTYGKEIIRPEMPLPKQVENDPLTIMGKDSKNPV